MADSNDEPIKFEPVDRATLFNTVLAQAGYALNQLRNTVGDGNANALTPEKLNQNALKKISKENKDESNQDTPTLVLGHGTGSLVDKYNLTNKKQSDFRSEWNDMDAKIINMSKVSAALANNVKNMLEPGLRDQIIGVRDTVADGKRDAIYGADPSTGKQVVVGYGEIEAQTQLWGVWRLDKVIDEAANSVQDAQNQFQAHPTDPIPVITPTYSYTPTPTYQTPWTYSGTRYQPIAAASYSQPMGKGEVEHAQTLVKYLMDNYGLSRAQAAGIVGNLEVESGLNTANWNSSEGAFGLAQWEGNRLGALKAFVNSPAEVQRMKQLGITKDGITDYRVQLDFIMHEFKSTEGGAWSQFSRATQPDEAASLFDQYYERSSGQVRYKRVNDAVQIYSGATA